MFKDGRCYCLLLISGRCHCHSLLDDIKPHLNYVWADVIATMADGIAMFTIFRLMLLPMYV